MGLFGMVKELAGTFGEVKDLAGEIEKIEHTLDQLAASGKCPAEIATALKQFEELEAGAKNGGQGLSAAQSLDSMKSFAKVLEANKDKLPADVSKMIEEFEGNFGSLSQLAAKFIK